MNDPFAYFDLKADVIAYLRLLHKKDKTEADYAELKRMTDADPRLKKVIDYNTYKSLMELPTPTALQSAQIAQFRNDYPQIETNYLRYFFTKKGGRHRKTPSRRKTNGRPRKGNRRHTRRH